MKFVIFIAIGVGLGIALGVTFKDQSPRPRRGDIIEATIFLQLPRERLEEFANGMPTADGKLRSVGNALGGTELTTVRHTGACGSAPQIEQYIRAFLQSDPYICYEVRYLR
jgi:hypothetical protein